MIHNIYSKGISQFDDIIHNSIGAALVNIISMGINIINIKRYTRT